MFMKKDLQKVVHERKSLMPAYDENELSRSELQDLLAYLQSLQTSGVRAGRVLKALPARGLHP